MAVSALASTTAISTLWLFVSQGRTREQLVNGIVVALLNVGSFVAGLPWGAAGVATASALCFIFVQTPFLCRAATRTGPVRARHLVAALAPFVVAGAAAAAAGFLAEPYVPAEGPRRLGAMLVLLYAVFGLALLCQPAGQRMLGGLWRIRAMLRAG